MRAARAVELGELLPGMRKGLTPSHVKERRMDSPRGSSLCPYRSAERGYAHAQGSPGARKRHAGKYGESTPSRQRGGGGGNASPLPTRRLRRSWPPASSGIFYDIRSPEAF